MIEQIPKGDQDERREGDDGQIVFRDRFTQNPDDALKARRTRSDQVFRAPGQQGQVLNDEYDTEGSDKLKQLRRLVDRPQDTDLDDHPDQANRQAGDQDARPEAHNSRKDRHGRVGDERPQHVERAVREIHDPRDAEDDRQTGCHEEQSRGIGQTGQKLSNKKAHPNSPSGP